MKANKLLKDIVIASHNPGKVSEIKSLLLPLGFNIISAKKLKINEPVENGLTFRENSLIKSKITIDWDHHQEDFGPHT